MGNSPYLLIAIMCWGSLTAAAQGYNSTPTSDALSAWQTVDNFQYTLNDNTYAYSLAANSSGTVYATGWGYDPSVTRHSLVQTSGDGGTTWSLLNDFTTFDGETVSIAVDPNGILYQSAAAILTTGSKNSWVTRQSTDRGATWTIVDVFSLGGGLAQPTGVATDSTGNVYVAGFAIPTSGNEEWIVRKVDEMINQMKYPNPLPTKELRSLVLGIPSRSGTSIGCSRVRRLV